jgi:3-oxoacyl-[acyl-carrier protein] reductase
VAVRLGQAGMTVAVHYAGNRNRAQETSEAVEATGSRALVVSADTADETQVAAMFDQVNPNSAGSTSS